MAAPRIPSFTNRRLLLRTCDLFGMSQEVAFAHAKFLAMAGEPDFAGTTGPRGGAKATPTSMAKFIIAAMSSEPKPQAAKAMRRIYNAPFVLGDSMIPPFFDEAKTPLCFGESLGEILSSPERAAQVELIQVRHGAFVGMILTKHHSIMRFADYDKRQDVARDDANGVMWSQSTLPGLALQAIAHELCQTEASPPPE